MSRIRFLLFIAVAAIAGAVAGRVAAELRRKQEAGEPLQVTLDDIKIRAQDVVPGLVAAARVRDTPWSWLHIPSWLAAFGVNLGVGAVGGDLSHIRDMAERAVFGFAGIELPFDDDVAAPSAPVYEVIRDDAAPPPSSPGAYMNGSGSVTWTAPGPAERPPEAPSGFTAFGD